MAGPVHALQPSFTAGELAPALQGRTDFAKYSTGLRTARNGFVHPTGGFSNRPGLKFVAAAKHSDKKSRVVAFEFSDSQTYIIEFGDQYCRFYTNGGQIQSAGNPYEISTPYLEADLALLKFVQSADTLYIAHGSYAPRTLVRTSDTSWVLSLFPFKDGPFNARNTDPTSTMELLAGPQLFSQFGIFVSGHIGASFRLSRSVVSSSTAKSIANGSFTDPIWALHSLQVLTTGTWSGTVSIQANLPGLGFTTITQFKSTNDANYNTFIDLSAYGYPLHFIAFAEVGTTAVNVTLTGDAFTFQYIAHIDSLVSASLANVTITNPPQSIFALFKTDDWSEGSWSVVQGWPSAVCFYEDRLCWAANETVWTSQTGDYVNYGISDPLVDSDAISVNLNSRKLNAVQNLVSMLRLIPLTSSSELSIGPGASGIFAPTSMNQKVEGSRGSSFVPPAVIGNTAIYIQPMGTVVRNIGYQYASDSFTGDNLSLLSSHLFINYSIIDLAYQQEPDSLVWAVRSDGELLSMTYMPEQQVIGWTHHDTQGTFESIASIPNVTLGINELWAIVNRTNGRFVERMAQRLPTFEVEDQFHVDCGISYDGAPTTVISGLDHLEGLDVITLADGSVQGPFTVSSGQITLTVEASLVHIGLAYTTDFENLNFEAQVQDGSSQGRRQRVAQATLRFLNSVGGYIGFDSSHLHPIRQRTTQALGSPIPLQTYDHREPITSSWTNKGRMFYRQTDPLPVTILAIVPNVEMSDL